MVTMRALKYIFLGASCGNAVSKIATAFPTACVARALWRTISHTVKSPSLRGWGHHPCKGAPTYVSEILHALFQAPSLNTCFGWFVVIACWTDATYLFLKYYLRIKRCRLIATYRLQHIYTHTHPGLSLEVPMFWNWESSKAGGGGRCTARYSSIWKAMQPVE